MYTSCGRRPQLQLFVHGGAMSLQVHLSGGPVAARGAGKGPLAGVSPEMGLEVALL